MPTRISETGKTTVRENDHQSKSANQPRLLIRTNAPTRIRTMPQYLFLSVGPAVCATVEFWTRCSGFTGTTIIATIYSTNPEPPRSEIKTHKMRTIVGSTPKYSAIPPQTPSMIRLCRDLYRRRLEIVLLFSIVQVYFVTLR